ncbi:MAG: hypothetical protein HFJ40_04625 [Clostridia bacterium]|nr:hypothetical protein [Clostridia bacterium]
MKYKKFYIILLSIVITNYIFWFYQLNFCTINPHLLKSIILVIPITFMISIVWLLKREKIKDILGIIITIGLIVISIVLNFFILVFVAVDEGTSYENNPLRYEHIYNIAGYDIYTYQFPNKIPNDILDSNNVRFFYCPQFLQGGFNLELLFEMDHSDIDSYISNFSHDIQKEIEINSENKHDLNSYGIHEPRFLFNNNEYDNFLKEAKFYILKSEPYKVNNWNHGIVQYMAKNELERRLLLVTQVW